MSHETLRQTFIDLIDAEAPVSQVGTGFIFTEGPVWHPLDHYLLFSDMPGDVRRRWDPEHGVVEVKRPANKCNGMTYDADLNLIVCEHATSLLMRERPDGRREVLASHFGGKELNCSQRRLRALGRLDLFHRSHLWPLAALWRRTAARARLSGRLSRARPPAARLSSWSTTIFSISRTACASLPTNSCSTSMIRRGS